MPVFAMMVGIEGSGRSRFARERLEPQGFEIISSDEVGKLLRQCWDIQKILQEHEPDIVIGDDEIPRVATADDQAMIREHILSTYVLEEVLRRIRAALGKGRNIAWDATNLIRSNRKERVAMAREWGANRIVCYWMNLPPSRCAANLTNFVLSTGICIDAITITRKTYARAKELEEPSVEEGFDDVIVVTEDEYGEITE